MSKRLEVPAYPKGEFSLYVFLKGLLPQWLAEILAFVNSPFFRAVIKANLETDRIRDIMITKILRYKGLRTSPTPPFLGELCQPVVEGRLTTEVLAAVQDKHAYDNLFYKVNEITNIIRYDRAGEKDLEGHPGAKELLPIDPDDERLRSEEHYIRYIVEGRLRGFAHYWAVEYPTRYPDKRKKLIDEEQFFQQLCALIKIDSD